MAPAKGGLPLSFMPTLWACSLAKKPTTIRNKKIFNFITIGFIIKKQ
jgi:hypothetical protein